MLQSQNLQRYAIIEEEDDDDDDDDGDLQVDDKDFGSGTGDVESREHSPVHWAEFQHLRHIQNLTQIPNLTFLFLFPPPLDFHSVPFQSCRHHQQNPLKSISMALSSAAAALSSSPNRSFSKMPYSSSRFFSVRASSSSPPTATAAAAFDLRSYWTNLIADIDSNLDLAIPLRYPPSIHEAMRYSVLAKGAKRAPPVMCIAAACDLLGLPRSAALPTACALEMVHAASLIHDDLPCMDDSPRRRGLPSNHAVFGVDMAVLAGDALFPLGFHHIVTHTSPDVVPHSRLLRVITEIARTVGSTGMAAGQFLDLTATTVASKADLVMEKKFGEMAACSAVCGGILAGADEEEMERLRNYGRAVGVLYQIVDDLRCSAEERETKGSRWSYVKLFGKEKAMKATEELRGKAKEELKVFDEKYGERALPLYSFVDYAVERGFDVAAEED